MDYRIWAVLQDQVHRQFVRDVDELKQRLIDSWSSIQQTVIDRWRVRLRAYEYVRAKDGLFNICCNVLLLHCWFAVYILALYDVSFKMFDAIMTTSKSSAILVMHICFVSQNIVKTPFR